MSIERNLQIRVPTPANAEIKEFEYRGKTFTILGESEKRNLIPDRFAIGTTVNGFYRQYKVECTETKEIAEVYVYYYGSFMGGERWAVIDTIELM